ncbi:MAG: FkbM family methyltransferase [Marinibacterium sp.]
MTQPTRQIDSLYGPLVVPDRKGDLVLDVLESTGEWAALESALAAALLPPGGALWDAGAFVGTFSLGLARHARPGRVLAIEADPDLAGCLRANLGLLPCRGNVVSAGLGPAAGWLVPARSRDAANRGADSYRFVPEAPEDPGACPSRTLADLRAEHGDYDLLKLDLEGMELDALRGDMDHLRARHPAIWAECNEDHASLRLMAGLKWAGYGVLYVAFPAVRAQPYRMPGDPVLPMAYEAALVAAAPGPLAAFAAHLDGRRGGEPAPPGTAPIPGAPADILCRPVETAFDLRRALFDTPRWGREDWAGLSRAELIARLGRAEQGIDLKTFIPARAE